VKWLDPPTFPVSEAEDPLRSLNLPPLIRRILLRRGFTSPEAAQSFLDPRPPAAPEALALPDAARAVERIQHALRRKEQIGIWGDFDVDGQTATALLVETLRAWAARCVTTSRFGPPKVMGCTWRACRNSPVAWTC
jgi:single-stranded-DNA-specific exonuclease